MKRKSRASENHALLTVDGLTGVHGLAAVLHVEMTVTATEQEAVRTHHHLTEVMTVTERINRVRDAQPDLVVLTEVGRSGLSGPRVV